MTASGKSRMGREGALELVEQANAIHIARGKKLTSFDLKNDRPDDDTLMEHMLGRTGNMRAPTILVGKTIVVGYNADLFEEVFLP